MNSLQALAELAHQDERLRNRVVEKLQEGIQNGSPAMKARCRKLLKALAA